MQECSAEQYLKTLCRLEGKIELHHGSTATFNQLETVWMLKGSQGPVLKVVMAGQRDQLRSFKYFRSNDLQ